MRNHEAHQYYASLPQTASIKPKLAGAMLVVAGVIGVIYAIYLLANIDLLTDMVGDLPEGVDAAMIEQILQVCVAVIIITSVLSIGGGFMALKRTRWGFALIGSIAAIVSIGPAYLCTILGIIALILLVLSKDEFR